MTKLRTVINGMRLIGILLIISTMLGCSSDFFPIKREIDQIEMVQLMTIDKCNETGLVEVAVVNKTGMETGGGEGASQENERINVLSGIGETAYEAVRNLKADSDKVVFFSHLEYFIIGESAAKENFGKYFDIISRDPELRFTSKIYIAKECMAKDLVHVTLAQDKYIVDRLKNMEDDERVLGRNSEVSIIEVIQMLNTPNIATVIPALRRSEIQEEISTEYLPFYDLATAGYAILKDFQLHDYIEESSARGYNFVVNKVKSTPISVKDHTGEYVALDLVGAETKVKGHFKGKKLTGVTFETYVQSNIGEQHSRVNLITKERLAEIKEKQEKIITEEMEKVIKFSQEIGTDCIELGKRLRMRYPFKWDHIENEWEKIFPEIDIKVKVIAKINRTYEINKPSGYELEQYEK